jgi:hypothetical protein
VGAPHSESQPFQFGVVQELRRRSQAPDEMLNAVPHLLSFKEGAGGYLCFFLLLSIKPEIMHQRWEEEQASLRARLVTTDDYDGDAVRYVAGADISFIKGDPVNACASLVVLSYPLGAETRN